MRIRSTTAACAAVGLAAMGLAACGGSGTSGSGGSGTGKAGSGASASANAASRYSSGTTGAAVATSSRSAHASASSTATVFTKQVKELGTILAAGPKQGTLYMFAADKDGKSMCNGACPDTWPPLTTSGTPHATGGVSASVLGTITRSNGEKQVTYHGHPLYYYAPDVSASDTFGEGVDSFGARWYVLSPSGKAITKG